MATVDSSCVSSIGKLRPELYEEEECESLATRGGLRRKGTLARESDNERFNDEDEFHSCDDDDTDSDGTNGARSVSHGRQDLNTTSSLCVGGGGKNTAMVSSRGAFASEERAYSVVSDQNRINTASPRFDVHGYTCGGKAKDGDVPESTESAGLPYAVPTASDEVYTYAGVVGGLVAAGLDAASAVGFGSCLDELGRGYDKIHRVALMELSPESRVVSMPDVLLEASGREYLSFSKGTDSRVLEDTDPHLTGRHSSRPADLGKANRSNRAKVELSSLSHDVSDKQSSTDSATTAESFDSIPNSADLSFNQADVTFDIDVSRVEPFNSLAMTTNAATISDVAHVVSVPVSSTASNCPFQYPTAIPATSIISRSFTPVSTYECDSPGVFFSCHTSLSDLSDNTTSHSGPQHIPNDASSLMVPPHLATQRRKYLRKKDSIHQCETSSSQRPASAGDNKTKSPMPVVSRGLADKRHVASSRNSEKSKLSPVNVQTLKTSTRTNSVVVGESPNPSYVVPLAQRRDAHKSLAPLTIFEPPPARRAKSASPASSHIPRPANKEKTLRRTPSGPNLSSQRSKAAPPSRHGRDPESFSAFKKRLKTPSPSQESARSDVQHRSKFVSGKGGTAWTVPASTDPHTNNRWTNDNIACQSTYTRSTVASASKRRQKFYSKTLAQYKHAFDSSSSPYSSYHALLETLRNAGDVCCPTPPSSCPPRSPVSFPSVGSSPIVLTNPQHESFFPCHSTALNPVSNETSLCGRDSWAEAKDMITGAENDRNRALLRKESDFAGIETSVNDLAFHVNVRSHIAGPVSVSENNLVTSTERLENHSMSASTNHCDMFSSPAVGSAQLYTEDSSRVNTEHTIINTDPFPSASCAQSVLCNNPSLSTIPPVLHHYPSSFITTGAQHSAVSSFQPHSLDSISAINQQYSLDSLASYAQSESVDSITSSHQLLFQGSADSHPPDFVQPNSLGDSNYNSLPLTADSLSEYPAFPSLPLSGISTGKDCSGQSAHQHGFGLGYDDSKSEDGLEGFTVVHAESLHDCVDKDHGGLRREKMVVWEKAKLRASLAWLLSKVYGADVPKEMQDPFYETSQGQLALRPVLVNLMSSSELYCQACANMFPETHAQWSGHWSIIQVLSRKGIYVSDTQESAVTETVLVQTAPFKLKAHLALIDALMRAYLCEVASVEKVVKAVRTFTKFPASSELPGSPEEALKFWINKVCGVISKEGVGACHKAKHLLEGDAGQKVLVSSSGGTGADAKEPVTVPLLEDLMRDIGDGSTVAALMAYYRPHLLNIKSICLKESIGIADSLYNLRLIGQFCRSHLPWRRFHLSYEDLLYTHSSMHINICTFLADLFFCFEGPGSSQANSSAGAIMTAKEKLDALPAAGKRSTPNTPASVVATAAATALSSVPISNATKRSFQRRPSWEDTAGNLGIGGGKAGVAGSVSSSHQPLLPRRSGGRRSFAHDDGSGVGGLLSAGSPSSPPTTARRGRRTVSLCSPQDRETVQRSVLAWQEDQRASSGRDRNDSKGPKAGSTGNSNLLANVSIDSNLDRSLNTDASISLDLVDVNTPRTGRDSALDPSHPDYMEMESVTSGRPSRFASPHSSGQPTGRLTAGQEEERDAGGGDRSQLEPLMPAVLKPTKEKDALLSKAQERGDRTPRKKKIPSPTEPSPHPHHNQHQNQHHQQQQQQQQPPTQLLSGSGDDLTISLSASSSETTVSPLSTEEGQAQFSAQLHPVQFYGNESVELGELPNSARSNAMSVAESYTLQDRPNTVQDARAAGIPVVSESVASSVAAGGVGGPDRSSREGSIASSGDYSDHESHKIHQDHKIRESSRHSGSDGSHNSQGPPAFTSAPDFSDKPAMVISHQLGNSNNSGSSNSNNNNNSNNTTTTSIKAPPFSNTTNFAELKRLKDKMEFNIDKSGSHGGPYSKTPVGGGDLKSSFLNSQGQGKTTTFGQLSPMLDGTRDTMALHNGRSSPVTAAESNGSVMTTSDPGSSELQQLRLKLEQKRKEIERKKHRQEAQQNKMRQRLGKAAFMRVVSKHMEEGEEGEEDMAGTESSPTLSTHAQLQARLGYNNTQRLPMSRPQPAVGQGHLLMAGAGGHQGTGSTLPAPEASAQRFTDWRSQTTGRGGSIGGDQSGRSAGQGPEISMGASTVGGQGAGGTHAFSRAGIQQTIDNVRNKWFSGGANDSTNLLVAPGLDTQDPADEDFKTADDSFRLHDGDLLMGGVSPRPSPVRESSHPQAARHATPNSSASPALPQHQRAGSEPRHVPSQSPRPQGRRSSDSVGEGHDPGRLHQQYQEYDSSLDKLNSSLSDLQGEIMRLSLKSNGSPGGGVDPRLSAALSAIGSTAAGTVQQPPTSLLHQAPQPPPQQQNTQTRPIHGIPHQAPYVQTGRQQQQQQQQQHQDQVTSVPYNQHEQQQQQLLRGGSISGGGGGGVGVVMDTSNQQSVQQQQHSIPVSQQQRPQQQRQQQHLEVDPGFAGLPPHSNKEGGFFVSFGENSSPKRAKPKLGEHRSITPAALGMSPVPPSAAISKQQQQQLQHQALWVPGTDLSPSPDLDPAVAAVVAGQAVAPLTPASKSDPSGEDKGGSPSVGFVIQDQATLVTDPTAEDEMQRKKTKLMEMQRKRKEDQERKRLEKEAELTRKHEEKMFKEEEQERRKAEERARRDQIFQQYMQKKNEEDNIDGPPSSHAQAVARAKVKRRDRSASNSAAANKQRPKSMFVKAATPEPGSLGGHDSCNSSQEDLARAGTGGRSTPGVMSAMRSAYHFRLPQQNRMRKAVSCNTLQGPASGQATFRRPPSPDLYRTRQQRQRGNSQDSGSDNGSNPGSNPGSDFSGPKLYVKPSAKSNRHIIVNAISHCCLAGSVNTDMKNKVLEEMSKCDANHFLILFRDAGCQYRGLFILYPDTEEAVKVCGVGPRHITNKMCEKFYKYNSGGKSFTEIVSKKHLSVSVDAVVLLNSLWKSGKAAVKR